MQSEKLVGLPNVEFFGDDVVRDMHKAGNTARARAIPNPDAWPFRPRTDAEFIRDVISAPGYKPARPMGVVHTITSEVKGVPPIVTVENQQPSVIGRNAMKRIYAQARKTERLAFVKREEKRRKAKALDTRVEFNSDAGVNPHA